MQKHFLPGWLIWFYRRYCNGNGIRFGLVGSKELCQWAASLIKDTLLQVERKPTATTVRESRPRLWEMRCYGRNAQILLNEMILICGNLVLERKWKVLEEFNLKKEWLRDKSAA